MCIGHFANHGAIVQMAPNEPKFITSFTDYVTLQTREHSPSYIGTVGANCKKMALKHNCTAISTFKVNSTVNLQIWVTNSINNPSHPVGIFVPANTATTVAFPALGDFTHRIIQVQNLSLTEKGNYEITIL